MPIEKVFASVFCVPVETIQDSTELKNISSWDSMTHMLLISRLEEEFQVQLTGDEIADMKTVGDARGFLRGHGATV